MVYGTVLAIHACAMSAALLLFVATEVLLVPARRGHGVPARMAFLASRCAGSLVGAGVLAGIALVLLGGWSPLTPWLVASFALIAVLLTVERKLVRPWAARAPASLRGTVAGIEIKAFAGDKRALSGRLAVIAIFALIVELMTVKPDLSPLA